MAQEFSTQLEAVDASTHSLLQGIAELSDQQVKEASLLPGWTRGHVLTHIARNADAMINLATWACTGVETPMYRSREERDAVIERQSGRCADEFRADIADSHARFLGAVETLTTEQLDTRLWWGAFHREATADQIPRLRRTEVEIHHVDLDLDYTLAHCPEDFVEGLLSDISDESRERPGLPDCVLIGSDGQGSWTIGGGGTEVTGPPPALLGWITGRAQGEGLHTDSDQLPRRGAWR